MDIARIIKGSRALHLLTNSILLGNRCRVRGRGSRVQGRWTPLSLRSALYIHGEDNLIRLGRGTLRRCGIRVIGHGNRVILEDGFRLKDATLWIAANGATIRLRGDNDLHNCELGIEGDAGTIDVGEGSLIGGYAWLEGQTSRTLLTRVYAGTAPVTIGAGCLISDDVSIRSHDSHAVFDARGEQVNGARPVAIADRCWIGSGAMLLKGVGVGEGCVVSARAVVTRDYSAAQNAILAGLPARVIREGIQWKP